MEFIDVNLDNKIIDNILIKLGPLCNESDKIIVDALLNKFTTSGKFEDSNLKGIIRK